MSEEKDRGQWGEITGDSVMVLEVLWWGSSLYSLQFRLFLFSHQMLRHVRKRRWERRSGGWKVFFLFHSTLFVPSSSGLFSARLSSCLCFLCFHFLLLLLPLLSYFCLNLSSPFLPSPLLSSPLLSSHFLCCPVLSSPNLSFLAFLSPPLLSPPLSAW